MSTKKNEDVIDKLDKVADTLESASSQLSGVVTQQQLDLVSQRLTNCESSLTSTKGGVEILARRTASHAGEAETANLAVLDRIVALEKEASGLRALALSAFALATISLIGLIILGTL